MVLVLMALLGSGLGIAGPVDIYGYGAASIGRGQGGVSIADGGMTVFRNPALLQGLEWAEASAGFGLFRAEFPTSPKVYWDTNQDGVLDSSDSPLSVNPDSPEADGMSLSMARNVGDKMGIALNAFLPTSRLMRFGTTEPTLPTWVMYGNRTQRVDLSVGAGVELYKGLSVGAAVEVTAMARYQISGTIGVGVGAASSEEDELGDLVDDVTVDIHQMTLDLVPRMVPIFGFHWDVGRLFDPLDGLQLGSSWRAESGIPVDAAIDLQLNGSIQNLGELNDMAVTLVMPIEFSVFDHYIPERWSIGASYQHKGKSLVYVDFHHTKWSGMEVNVARVTASAIRSQLFDVKEDLVDDANDYNAVFKDTQSIHTGTEIHLPVISTNGNAGDIVPIVRAGIALVPSPLVSQDAGSAFLDSDRMLFSFGAGVIHEDPTLLLPGPIQWDLFYTSHLLAEGSLAVADAGTMRPGAPVNGEPMPIGGSLWSAGMQLTVSF
jgi:long-subunit fatty acid transport protein